ncbi:hypothetical protein ILUMI_02896 [Ignelater luminosus]|uniref:Uncharacterized protein n=1 Tax=Ignelater luminosus TaxID=2038154 RepID=A0A8K0GG18_IGNLU|nr:hypothetical protein ILUMI_02896 [Ignelater luminosus]
MAKVDTTIPKEPVNLVNLTKEELFDLVESKEKSEKALEEAKRIADEVKKEFDRNIKEVQEVASKIFTEAKGKLQQRFEEIERETNKFVAGTKIEILRTVNLTKENTPAVKTEEEKPSTSRGNKKQTNKNIGKVKGKITQAIDKLKKGSKKEPKKPNQDIKVESNKIPSDTKGKINKIIDRVKKLKQQVEANQKEVNKPIGKIEERISKTISNTIHKEKSELKPVKSELKPVKSELKPVKSELKPKESVRGVEELLEFAEEEIIRGISKKILENATKKIIEKPSTEENKSENKTNKSELSTKQEISKVVKSIVKEATKEDPTKPIQNKIAKNSINPKKQIVKAPENQKKTSQETPKPEIRKVTIQEKPKSATQIKSEPKKVTIQPRAKSIERPNRRDSSLEAKRDLERTFEELKEQTAKFSEIADIDLKKAIENIKLITGRIPRRVLPAAKREIEGIKNEFTKIKTNTIKTSASIRKQTGEVSNKTIKRELVKHLKESKDSSEKVISKPTTEAKKIILKQLPKKGTKEEINKLIEDSKSEISKQSDKSNDKILNTKTINKPQQLPVRKHIKVT